MRPLSLAALAFALATTPAFAAESGATWQLTATRIYPSPDARPIDDGVLTVRDGRIAAVGRKGDAPDAAGSPHGQCSGGVVTAGFQNSHVHFLGDAWRDAARRPAAELTRAMETMLTRFGYTTVVDIASNRDDTLALRKRVEGGEVAGPRILTSGWALFPSGGLPVYIDHLPSEFRDRLPKPASADEAARIVRENVESGADATKLFLVTPQPRGQTARMAQDVARAAADESHRRGKPVFAHPTDADGVRAAIAAGVDVLSHSTLGAQALWPDAFLREVIASKMAIIPTLKLLGYELAKEGVPPAVAPKIVSMSVEQVKIFHRAGGTVLFGTDVGYMTDFDPTEEYVLLARAGLTPMQILATMTTVPAARWNESGRRGRLEAGLDADIVVLDADPASDPAAFARVRCAFRAGKLVYAR